MDLLDNVNLAASVWDYALLGLLILASFLYGLTLGKNRILAINLSAFIAFLFVNFIPWTSFEFLVKQEPSSSFKIFMFLALTLGIFFLIPKSSLTSALRLRKRGEAAWWQLLLFGAGQVGLLAAMVGSFLDKKAAAAMNPLVQKYIFSELGLFLFLTLNIVFMLFLKKKKDED